MKHTIIIACLLLTACNTPESRAQNEIAQCQELGIAQKDMAACRLQVRAIMAQERGATAAAWSASSAASNAMRSTYVAPQPFVFTY